MHCLLCVLEGERLAVNYHPNDVNELVPMVPFGGDKAQSCDHIAVFIRRLTGFQVKEEAGLDGYSLRLRLGSRNPILVGFSKEKHPGIQMEDARYSGYVYLLGALVENMKDPNHMSEWLRQEIEHIISSN